VRGRVSCKELSGVISIAECTSGNDRGIRAHGIWWSWCIMLDCNKAEMETNLIQSVLDDFLCRFGMTDLHSWFKKSSCCTVTQQRDLYNKNILILVIFCDRSHGHPHFQRPILVRCEVPILHHGNQTTSDNQYKTLIPRTLPIAFFCIAQWGFELSAQGKSWINPDTTHPSCLKHSKKNYSIPVIIPFLVVSWLRILACSIHHCL
jgi:hypothetical protein